MSNYRVAEGAKRDLSDIWLYIARHDLRAADRWLAAVENCFTLLGGQPFLGQERDDLLPGLRFLPVGQYLIFYLPKTDGIQVIRVIHGSRNYGSGFF